MSSTTSNNIPELQIRGTFLDLAYSDDAGEDLSPRAHSDPGSVSCTSADALTQTRAWEEDYLQSLSQAWSRRVAKSLTSKSETGDEAMNEPEDHNGHHPLNQEDIRKKNAPEDAVSVTRTELTTHIRKATNVIKQKMNRRRDNDMLSAIQEIPEQIGDALQKSAGDIVVEVMGQVHEVTDMIRSNGSAEASTATAVINLEAIPDSLQEHVKVIAAAQRHVEAHVKNLVHDMEARGRDDVVNDMIAMPQEVEVITREALSAAALFCRVEAQEQVEHALQSLPSIASLGPLEVHPRTYPMVEACAKTVHDVAAEAVEVALGMVKKQDEESLTVANQVVADALLRAKAGEPLAEGLPRQGACPQYEQFSGGSTPLASYACTAVSLGSIGHPELCSRPCIYVVEGKCANGRDCNFCHLPHPKRPVHLDKQHRDLLKGMRYLEMLFLLMPVLEAKVMSLNLGSAALEQLHKLLEHADTRSSSGWQYKKVLGPLSSMSLRSLLSMLLKAGPSDQERECLERLMQTLRHQAGGSPLAVTADGFQ
mmetsp:Transcript_52579/g.123046  ORF Transcript_52579/g.123046 Transcript_52579/m.123046 type:complete len:537 (-) Transcript_52579:27-1637(-)